jgi:hypothetical protein
MQELKIKKQIMEAKELRVGNYIYDDNNVVSNIKGIESSIYAKRGSEEYSLRIYIYPRDSKDDARYGLGLVLCRPIPLTEEWLLKFGFTRHHADYSNGVIFIKSVPNNTEFEWGIYPNELGSGVQIKNRVLLKHVHQLQNLYFALTGEELTVKEYEE